MHCLFFDVVWVAGEGLQFVWWTGCFGIVGRGDPGKDLLRGGGILWQACWQGQARWRKNLAFIALIHVVTTGLKQIRWYQIARFCLLSSVEI